MRQQELFEAETSWFHVFKAMIESGDIATIGPYAVTVYLVIKSYTNFSTGYAFPSVELIAEKAGISEVQTKRCLKILADHGFLTKEKKGRRNVYRLREKINIADKKTGRPTAVATWDYLPNTVEAARAELRDFVLKGAEKDSLQYIHIDHLTLNIQTGEHATQVNLSDIKDAELRKQIADLLAKASKKG